MRTEREYVAFIGYSGDEVHFTSEFRRGSKGNMEDCNRAIRKKYGNYIADLNQPVQIYLADKDE